MGVSSGECGSEWVWQVAVSGCVKCRVWPLVGWHGYLLQVNRWSG